MKARNVDSAFLLVTRILEAEFGIDAALLRPEADVRDDLDLDSLDAVDLAARLEEETGLKIADDALTEVRTLADIVSMVEARLGARSA